MRLLPSQPQPRLRKGEKSQLEKELMDLDRKEVWDCWDSSFWDLTYYGFIWFVSAAVIIISNVH